jgi:uncharacterized protein (TIGR03084 family)
MIEQALDFREEADALARLIEARSEQDWERKTQFKGWTINDVIAHLHFADYAADLSLRDAGAFKDFVRDFNKRARPGARNVDLAREWLGGAKDRVLLRRWRDFYRAMADRFAAADPKHRVVWFGPDMSVRSSITARLMETWAHGQAIYDLLGTPRVDRDRIKNIVVIGVNTFGWTFSNRSLPVPPIRPSLRLRAPSGATWEWAGDATNLIEGSAVEFCQVVTQTRNIADTKLRVTGETAKSWMAIAQCFAGPPENPPAAGTRSMLIAN